MRDRNVRLLLVAAFAFLAPSALLAQARPSPAEAEALLQTRPDLVAQLRQRIATSGMSPEQIRARLRAEGYPESLLDSYMDEAAGAPGSDGGPTAETMAAVRALGIADSTDAAPIDTRSAIQCPVGGVGRGSAAATSTDSGAAGGRQQTSALEELCRLRDSLALEGTANIDELGRVRRPADGVFPADSGFRIFGLDVFRQLTSQFNPNAPGPVDAGYRLGPGDRLVLILTGDVEAAYQLDVTREGFVVIPQVGRVDVANLTLGELEDLLFSRLGRIYSGVRRGGGATTRFSVSVANLRSNQVFVMGDVTRPGSYRISSAGTALTALYAAGGPTQNGSLRRIVIRRGGRSADTLDLYDYLLHGDASRDVRLQNGDVVFVPVHGPRARVVGEVTRPAVYEIAPGESLSDALGMAGGFTPTAARRRVQIERILPPTQRESGGRDRVVVDVAPTDAFTNGGGSTVAMQAGDVVRVFAVATRVRNRIVVRGNVWTPGSQGFSEGMKISDAIRTAGGVKPGTYLGRILVTRLQPDSTRAQLRAALQDTTGAVIGDLPLQEDDEIQVFSVSEFRPERYVAVSGAVRKAGRYPYHEGMTMRDLVLTAGGILESAYLREAEIARLPESRSNGVTAQTFRTPLDSSYLFERGPDGTYAGPPGLPAPSGPAPEIALKPYDNVLILEQPDWELQRNVYLSGQVRFPGRYALVTKTERLTDVIKRAGGLTSEAYPEGVYFFRRHNNQGRIGIDLPRALRQYRDQDNLLLQDGDSVFIPLYNAAVNVTGAVNSPVAVSYVPGKDLTYYVRAAGGPSRRADLGRAYVTQPNGKLESTDRRRFLPDGVPQPRAGSVVVVPEQDPADRRDTLAIFGAVAQITATLVTVALAIVAARR
jgi:protein involved in polysaccharide export with SLBB domain